MNTRILIFSIAYRPYIGGAETAVEEITKRLGGFSFDMVTLRFEPSWPAVEKIGNVTLYRVGGSKLLFPFRAFLKARMLAKQNSYGLIWSIMANRAGFAALFFKLLKPKIPFVLTLQEGDVLEYPIQRMGIFAPIFAPLFRLIFRNATVVTAISTYLERWGKSLGARKTVVIPNGVALESFARIDWRHERARRRHQFGFDDTDTVLITTSRLVEKNAVDDIIAALEHVPAAVKLLVVGDGPLKEALSFQVARLHFEHRVKFAGSVGGSEIPSFLSAGDIFIRPSRSEGFGNSFVEAMAAGLPVIATPVGGIPDYIRDGYNGIFCQVGNPASIAEKVLYVREHPEVRASLITHGRETANRYDWKYVANQMNTTIFTPLLS